MMFLCSWGRTTVSFLLSFLFFLTVSNSVASQVDERLEQFTGGHTRLVWVQDRANGDDTLAQKNAMRVMAYDSRDGKGVRVMIEKLDNYYKPFFTPDGKTIVVSTRNSQTIYTIDFETGHIDRFADGVAVAVWQDEDGRKSWWGGGGSPITWIYALDGEGDENHKLSHKSLVRYRLDKPRKREVVWDKTPLSWSNLDLSQDGSIIGGLFPWPFASVLYTERGELKRIGKGCWTSLSPGNDKILWVFDGAHRNLTFTDIVSGETWKTNINGAPGIDGYEVYHPRWSNHFNYFAITGPYKEGEGGNKIGGGGKEVEIYLGRFDNSLKNITGWFKLTDNNEADFFPDLWIAGGESSYQNYKAPDTLQEVHDENLTGVWPRGVEKAVFLWQNFFEPNQLKENSPIGFSQNSVEPTGKALFNRFGDMELRQNGFVAEYKEVEVVKNLQKQQYFGIEMLYVPSDKKQSAGGLFAIGSENGGKIESIRVGNDLEVRMPGQNITVIPDVFVSAVDSYHFFIELHGERLQVYLNSELIYQGNGIHGALDSLDSGRLVFGASGTTDAGLTGAVSHVALYGRTISEQEIKANAALVRREVQKRQSIESIELTAELIEKSMIPAPDSLGAYSRALTVNRYRVVDVLNGSYENDEILVASWAVLDRVVTDTAMSEKEGVTVTFRVESFDDHPELEGERLMMDMFEPDLDLYYSMGD